MKSFSALIVFLSLANFAKCDKILVLSFFSSKSHKITYMGLLEELAKRGHEITIVSPIKAFKEIKNIREIHTIDVEAEMAKKFDPFKAKEEGSGLTNPSKILAQLGLEDICRRSYDLPVVKQLLKEKFDMVFMIPLLNDCAFGLAYRLQIPLVLFFPTSVPSHLASVIGNHFPPSFVPHPLMDYSDDMTFYQRFLNLGISLVSAPVIKYMYRDKMEAIYREKLGADIPGLDEILANTSLILSNGHFSLNRPKPYLPDIVDVGGIHSKPAQPLPKDLEDFVSKGKDGFILFSMGSAIKGDTMPEAKRKMFLNVFSKLKQQVLWKWETDMPNLPKNVKLSKWLPQQDILGHKGIRMFITHCGMGGTEEAIYHGVPLLGLPMFAEQPTNAQRAKKLGFLVEIDWNDLTEDTLIAGIQELLNNNTYRENVRRLSAIFKDQPQHPLQTGAFWVEYVLRHKGAPQLRSATRKLNSVQYHSIDVIAAYLAIISALLYLVFATLRFICRKVCGCFGKSDKSKTPNVNRDKKKIQ